MKYTYRLTSDSEGFTATCVEMDVSAAAPTQAGAISALREGIYERLTHVEAVAPPASVPVPSIELEPARDSLPEPQGPGDPPRDEARRPGAAD
jgi:hypothetical protein